MVEPSKKNRAAKISVIRKRGRYEQEDRRLAHQHFVNWQRRLKEIERMLGPIDWDDDSDRAVKAFNRYTDLIEAGFDSTE